MPRQNTKPTDYPKAVLKQIELLAQHIVIARKRRSETQAQWAKRLGVSQPTMARIERGDPSVAMASYVMCMWLINQAEGLADLIAPPRDQVSLEREVARVRPRRKPAVAKTAPLPGEGFSVPRLAAFAIAPAAKQLDAPGALPDKRWSAHSALDHSVGLAALLASSKNIAK